MREKITLTISPDLNGIWINSLDNELSSGRIASYDELELPEELIARFNQWFEAHDTHRVSRNEPFDPDLLNKKGLELAKHLKQHLFYRATVF